MNNETPSKASACPLCGITPEKPASESMVWSDFCKCDICTTCAIALPMKLYDKENSLFASVARLLDLDIWECRKRFLVDSIEKTREQLPHEVERNIIGFLKTGIIRCTAQIKAIDRFLDARKSGAAPEELAEEEKKLEETLFGMPF